MAACKAYPLRPWEKLTFEYVLLKGVNDSDADARRVVKLLAQSQCQSEPDRIESRPGNSVRDSRSGAGCELSDDRAARVALFYTQAARTRYLCRLRSVAAQCGNYVGDTFCRRSNSALNSQPTKAMAAIRYIQTRSAMLAPTLPYITL